MKKYKSQTVRILDVFVAVTVVVISLMLVASGISVSRINTEYMETGVRAAKIVAERENSRIMITNNEALLLSSGKKSSEIADKILTFLPPPVNTVYLSVREFVNPPEDERD